MVWIFFEVNNSFWSSHNKKHRAISLDKYTYNSKVFSVSEDGVYSYEAVLDEHVGEGSSCERSVLFLIYNSGRVTYPWYDFTLGQKFSVFCVIAGPAYKIFLFLMFMIVGLFHGGNKDIKN